MFGRSVVRHGLGYVRCGGALCHLRIWSEAEWARVPAIIRPPVAVYAPGLGWVGAVPIPVRE